MKQIQLSVEKAKTLFGKNTELDEILKENFTEEELGLKKPLPKNMNEVNTNAGWRCGFNGVPVNYRSYDIRKCYTMEQALSVDAYMQLTQAMKDYNGDWVPDWENKEQTKYTVDRVMDRITGDVALGSFKFLVFPTPELRDEFMKNFEQLIKQFYQS